MNSVFNFLSDFHTSFSKNRNKELRRAKIIGAIIGKYPHKWFYKGMGDTGYSIVDVLKCSRCGKEVITNSFADYPSYKWCDEGK